MSLQIPPKITEGQVVKFWQFVQNPDGTLSPGGPGSGGSTNVNITGLNGPAPAFTNAFPVELSDGTNPVGTPGNPLSVNVITGGSNASIGLTGAAAPTSATEIGWVDGSGKLQNVSVANPLPVSVTAIVADNVNQGNKGTIPQSWYTQLTDGSAAIGVLANPLRVDPTGTTTQPVSLPVGQAVELLDAGGTNKASISAAGAVKVDGSAVTQPVSGTVTATVAAVGTNAATAPTSSIEIGTVDVNGKLQGASAANPVPVTIAGASASGGNVLTQDNTPGTGFIFQEILMELRAIRKTLMVVYEESGQGNLALDLVDDVNRPSSVDYN
jgi:hypothetical protein